MNSLYFVHFEFFFEISGKRVLTKKGSAFTLIRQEKALQELITKQTEVQEWIQSILNVRFESDNFVKNLEDGFNSFFFF